MKRRRLEFDRDQTDIGEIWRMVEDQVGRRATIILFLLAIGLILFPLVVFAIGVTILLAADHTVGFIITGIGVVMQLGLRAVLQRYPVNRR